MSMRRLLCLPVTCGCALLAGCGGAGSGKSAPPGSPTAAQPASSDPYAAYGSYYGAGEIKFLDAAQSNVPLDPGVADLSFVTPDGRETSLKELSGERDVVLVVTRGNTNPICPYCSTQTARLISSYDQFTQRGAEVVVIYPVQTDADKGRLDEYLQVARSKLEDPNRPVPFPVLLDVELKSVDKLGIRKDLSKPAAYIVDRGGHVRFAYVGSHLADRPSAEALLTQLDALKTGAGGPSLPAQ